MSILREVVGRLEDVVVGPDGRQMVRFHGIFVDLPHIRDGQVIREALDLIRVVVDRAPGLDRSDADEVERRVHQRLGSGVRVVVQTVASIPRGKSGKFKSVVCRLSNDEKWNLLKPGAQNLAAISDKPVVTVILPVRNEAHYIERGLAAVLGQDYPSERLEILVVDGMSTDGTRAIVEGLGRSRPQVGLRLLDNPGVIVPTGMNIGLGQAHGEIIVRVDGHCEIAPDYVRRCVEHILEDGVDGVGGSLDTVGETRTAEVIAAAMSTRFGVGDSASRTERGKTRLTDSVPFPAYTRSIIRQAGGYDEELVRCQDDEYSYRLLDLGAKILLAGDVNSRYYSRGSLSDLRIQYFRYGYWKIRVFQKHPRQMRPRQFAPPLFVLSLILALILSVSFHWGWTFLAGIGGCYILANLGASAITAAKKSWEHFPLLPLVYATLHLSYGLGFLVGLVKFWNRWGDKRGKVPEFKPRESKGA